MSFCLAGLYCIVQRNIFFRTPMCKRTSAYKVVALEDGQVPSASGFSIPAIKAFFSPLASDIIVKI